MLEEYGLTEGNFMTDWHSKMSSTLKKPYDDCKQDAHSWSYGNYWENPRANDLLNSFMMNQTTPHLGAWSHLINNERSNHHE
jgi:hypothetical protein